MGKIRLKILIMLVLGGSFVLVAFQGNPVKGEATICRSNISLAQPKQGDYIISGRASSWSTVYVSVGNSYGYPICTDFFGNFRVNVGRRLRAREVVQAYYKYYKGYTCVKVQGCPIPPKPTVIEAPTVNSTVAGMREIAGVARANVSVYVKITDTKGISYSNHTVSAKNGRYKIPLNRSLQFGDTIELYQVVNNIKSEVFLFSLLTR